MLMTITGFCSSKNLEFLFVLRVEYPDACVGSRSLNYKFNDNIHFS